ncbi:hypothetical protein AHAS_Ahas11G0086600 [Arachis hypogaea]
MASGFGESTTTPRRESHPSPSCSGNNGSNDAGDFECNICFDLAQDPVITLCGHLFCWPCLYMWLHHHSQCQECPVCKALVQEEKLVPLYGRGKAQTDPRTKSYPGMEVPRRPSGQRPETEPQPPPQQPGPNLFGNYGFGLMGGFIPMATATFGNFTLSTAFGGFIPSLLNIQFQPFHDATVYGTTSGYPFGFTSHQGGNPRGFTQAATRQELRPEDNALKNLLLLIGCLFVTNLYKAKLDRNFLVAENDADIDRLNETSHYAEAADFERHRLLLPWRVSHILLPPDAIFPYLVEVRFGDTVSLRDLTFDNSLISVFVER